MRSALAGIRTLVLPWGAVSGARIVLDGNTGEISMYDASNNLIGLLTPLGRTIGSTVLLAGFWAGLLGGTAADYYIGMDLVNPPSLDIRPGALNGISFTNGYVSTDAAGGIANATYGIVNLVSPYPNNFNGVDAARLQLWSRSKDRVTTGSKINIYADQVAVGSFDQLNGKGKLLLESRAVCTRQANVSASATTSGTDTNTNAAYQNCAGTGSQTSVSITKDYDAATSKLLVRFSGSAYATAAAAECTFGVNINAVDNDLIHMTINALSTHTLFAAERFVTGLAAGTYTCQMRWKRPGGTGTLTRDSFDWLSLTVEEVPA